MTSLALVLTVRWGKRLLIQSKSALLDCSTFELMRRVIQCAAQSLSDVTHPCYPEHILTHNDKSTSEVSSSECSWYKDTIINDNTKLQVYSKRSSSVYPLHLGEGLNSKHANSNFNVHPLFCPWQIAKCIRGAGFSLWLMFGSWRCGIKVSSLSTRQRGLALLHWHSTHCFAQ